MTLYNLDLVINELEAKKKEKFKSFFFVSIDPTRDTPKVIKNYLDGFDNDIFGITGDPKKFFYYHNHGAFYLKKFLLKRAII